MANQSIYAAFERMWQHINARFMNKDRVQYVTQAEYNALGDAVNTDGVLYVITDGNTDAENINYDNSISNLTAANVQDAVDELAQSFQDGCDKLVADVTAKGATPVSNSPDDIIDAYSQVIEEGKISNSFTNVGYMYWLNASLKDVQTINTTYLTKTSANNFTVKEDFNAFIMGTFHVAQTTKPYITLKINGTQVMKVTCPGTSNRVATSTYFVKLKAGDVITGTMTKESSNANNSSAWFGIYKVS